MRHPEDHQTEDMEVDSEVTAPSPEMSDDRFDYLRGSRFWLVFFSIGMIMFLVTFEIPVVATSLVAITDDVGGVDERTWLLTSYLLGYVSFIVVACKLSDIYGRQPVFIACVSIFLLFSALCSAAQTMTQL
ncbi:MFS general substrate transporter [Xylariomycetidae sp. FL0641]|nr:MFS general substrate transporter [Xylariomycetidae sp. FL0641]